MNTVTIIFICSISFQVAGALLLMCFSLSTSRKKTIQRFASSRIIHKDGNTGKLYYKKEVFRNCFREAYLNRVSFFYIALGYMLSVFGKNDCNNYFIVCSFIILVTAFLMSVTHFIVKQVIARKKTINSEITDDELQELDIKPDMPSLSYAKIDEIMKN